MSLGGGGHVKGGVGGRVAVSKTIYNLLLKYKKVRLLVFFPPINMPARAMYKDVLFE